MTAEKDWPQAWADAQKMLAGTQRGVVSGADPGVELATLDWGGSGGLVLMHHANGFCAATLAPIAVALRDRYRVVSLDARGHGDSNASGPDGTAFRYDWARLVDDLDHATDQLLERTGQARVELALGHSFGGALMLSTAARRPRRFARILACDPVVLPVMTPEQQQAHAQESGLVAATRRRRDRFESRAAAFAYCRSKGLFADFTPEALALYVGEGMRETEDGTIALKCDRTVEAAIFAAGGTLDLNAGAGAVTAEVRILHALRGNFSREAYDALAAEMPRAQVESRDVGHLFPLETPEVAISAAEALLACTPAV